MAGELKRERSFGTLAVMQIVSGGSAGELFGFQGSRKLRQVL